MYFSDDAQIQLITMKYRNSRVMNDGMMNKFILYTYFHKDDWKTHIKTKQSLLSLVFSQDKNISSNSTSFAVKIENM